MPWRKPVSRPAPTASRSTACSLPCFMETDAANPDLDRAIEEADRAVEILDSLPDSRNRPEIYRMAGGLYLIKGDSLCASVILPKAPDYQRALQLLQRSIAIDRSWRAEYDRKGGAEWARRHSAIAAADQGDPEARWMLAAAYLRLGNDGGGCRRSPRSARPSSRGPRGVSGDCLRFHRPESDR